MIFILDEFSLFHTNFHVVIWTSWYWEKLSPVFCFSWASFWNTSPQIVTWLPCYNPSYINVSSVLLPLARQEPQSLCHTPTCQFFFLSLYLVFYHCVISYKWSKPNIFPIIIVLYVNFCLIQNINYLRTMIYVSSVYIIPIIPVHQVKQLFAHEHGRCSKTTSECLKLQTAPV